MNNRGQVVFFTLMIAIVIIILALAFSAPLKQIISDARNADNLDCGNESISNFDKTACLVSDVSLFGFIIGLITLAGAVIGARLVFSE